MLIAAQVIPQAAPISASVTFVLVGFVLLAFGIIVSALILSKADEIRRSESAADVSKAPLLSEGAYTWTEGEPK